MNKRIYIAIVLLGTSMLGVIYFQAYWLRQNHKNELVNFRHDVYRSLSVAMNTELDARIGDLVENMDVDVLQDSTGNYRVRGRRMHKMNKGNSSYYQYQESLISGNVGDTIENSPMRGGKQFNYNNRQLDRVVLSLMSKMDDTQHSPGARFNSDIFNEAFKSELSEFGIDIDYKLALLVKGNKVVKEINGSFEDSEFSNATYFNLRHSAMPGAKLAVFFPDRGWYIASKNRLMSFASIILILLSIGSIIYIIRSFFSQKRISEIRRDFMNNMTHELKTPISTVGLVLEAMQDFNILDDKKKTDRYIDIARKENHRLGMLVEKVLKMSAYERENIHMKWEDLQADITVENVVNNLTFQIENKGGVVSKNMEANSVLVKVDKVHFTNIIYNLVDNALKYSGEKPKINVSTYVKNDFWFVEVSDNGIGIPVTYQNKIFEKFFRVPSGNVHNVKGYGLGLSYVFNIVNRFDGDISVKSEVDKGSTFIIKLPVSNG
ncbi:MAG: HAMP domain-containing histidine kinase [Flavobacteriales bacterium]|nr:HAMP domain-containing histidine kinase [Flavobacteriales bacterium]